MRRLILVTSVVLFYLGVPVWADMVPATLSNDLGLFVSQETGLYGDVDLVGGESGTGSFFSLDLTTPQTPSDEQTPGAEDNQQPVLGGDAPAWPTLIAASIQNLDPIDLSGNGRDFAAKPGILREPGSAFMDSMRPRHVPSPGATMLALVGLPLILLARRRGV